MLQSEEEKETLCFVLVNVLHISSCITPVQQAYIFQGKPALRDSCADEQRKVTCVFRIAESDVFMNLSGSRSI